MRDPIKRMEVKLAQWMQTAIVRARNSSIRGLIVILASEKNTRTFDNPHSCNVNEG